MDIVPLWERLKRLLSKQNSVDNSFVYSLLADAEAGKESALPFLFSLLLDTDAQVSADMAEAITRLTGDFSSKDWRRLDVSMRWHGGYNPSGFPQVTVASLASLKRFGSQYGTLLGLASMNGNGFVRQEAVRRLTVLSDNELPFLLIRLNDWVEGVRQEALSACVARLRTEYADRYIEALPLVLGLRAAGRNDFHDFIASVEEFVTRIECRPALMEGLDAHDALIRRASFRLALAVVGENDVSLFEWAFLNHDTVVRRTAARLLCARPADDAVQRTFLDRLSKDKVAAIRSEYLLLCYEKYPDRAESVLRDALFDINPSVRSVAQFYLRRDQTVDIPQFYRRVLEEPIVSLLAPTIAGLGETGQASDAEKIVGFLHHPAASVRRAAVLALGRLDSEADTPQLLQALNDDSARVSRAAREAMEPHLHLIANNVLWDTFTTATSRHGRRNTLRLLYALPKWRAIVPLLKAGLWLQDNTDEILMSELRANIVYWLARNPGIPPTRNQLSLLQESLPRADVFLPASVVLELRRYVQNFERFIS